MFLHYSDVDWSLISKGIYFFCLFGIYCLSFARHTVRPASVISSLFVKA